MAETIATIKEVQKVIPYISTSSASRKIQLIRDTLNKQKPKMITMKEFNKYFGL
jgi:hypothetical protein